MAEPPADIHHDVEACTMRARSIDARGRFSGERGGEGAEHFRFRRRR